MSWLKNVKAPFRGSSSLEEDPLTDVVEAQVWLTPSERFAPVRHAHTAATAVVNAIETGLSVWTFDGEIIDRSTTKTVGTFAMHCHYHVEMVLENGKRIYFERNPDGICMGYGSRKKDSSRVTSTFRVSKFVPVGRLHEFRREEDSMAYNVMDNNCKHTAHRLVAFVLQCSCQPFEVFRDSNQEKFVNFG